MVNNYAGWPASVVDQVTGINASLKTLVSLVAVCQSEGILRHNYKIIVDLLPRLIEESYLIYNNALAIRSAAPRRRGRPRKWVTVAEEITALAITLLEATADIETHQAGNYWSTVALLLSIMGRTIDRIAAEIDQITLDSIPAAFLEVLNNDD